MHGRIQPRSGKAVGTAELAGAELAAAAGVGRERDAAAVCEGENGEGEEEQQLTAISMGLTVSSGTRCGRRGGDGDPRRPAVKRRR